ncbi:hypothetical protein [Streptomyces halobius]|uniref:Uncharacterized protein n=1 Tax=Streptomyces halobius TaxID=2879846 RepID=A0ABY4MGQ4_9ACTN|nr:hypothetical protein [Streptomyces halobius]UQA95506.1 hypothetical protein K9S39_29880 [Streptomyces halobius]
MKHDESEGKAHLTEEEENLLARLYGRAMNSRSNEDAVVCIWAAASTPASTAWIRGQGCGGSTSRAARAIAAATYFRRPTGCRLG